MADPVRLQILQGLLERVQAIRVENGYYTDAGARVSFGEVPEFGEGDPIDAIAMLVSDSPSVEQAGFVEESLVVEFQAFAKALQDDGQELTLPPGLLAETVLADIKRAVEQDDRYLGATLKTRLTLGNTTILPRQPGSTSVGISVTYAMSYMRKWGAI